MAFRDLDEFLKVEPIVLPIRGKEYSFPGEISARSWLLVQRLGEQFQAAARAKASGVDYDPDEEAIPEGDYSELSAELFGGADVEMAADGLTSAHVKLVFATLLAYHLSGSDAAEAVWNNQGEPSAPNREVRRNQSSSRGNSHAGSKPRTTPMAARGSKS